MPDGPPGKRPRTPWLAYTAQDSQKSSASCDGNIPAKAPGRGETRPPMHEFGSDSPFGLPSRSVETARSAQAWGIAPLRGAGGVILFGPRSNESVGSPCGGIEIAKRGSPPSRTRDRFLRTILRMPARTSRAPARSPPSASTRPTPLGPRPLGSTACPTTGGTLGFRPPQTCERSPFSDTALRLVSGRYCSREIAASRDLTDKFVGRSLAERPVRTTPIVFPSPVLDEARGVGQS